MMKHTKIVTALAAVGLGIGFAGCGGGSTVLTPPPPPGQHTTYVQIERLSRPAIKEVFEPFQDHQKSNAAEPYNDPTILADIGATTDAFRGSAYGTTLQAVLYPDEYAVNLSGANPGSTTHGEYFLSNETSNGADFGGRAPNDDVINLELSILFGKTLSNLGLVTDDGQENNCLSSQNIAGQGVFGGQDPSKTAGAAFPYFAPPH